MKEEVIQFIGLNDLEDIERQIVKDMAEDYYPKIKRMLKNITSMVVHIKQYDKEGKNSKFSVNIRVMAPTREFEANKAVDWDLARVMHKGFKDVIKVIEHRLQL